MGEELEAAGWNGIDRSGKNRQTMEAFRASGTYRAGSTSVVCLFFVFVCFFLVKAKHSAMYEAIQEYSRLLNRV